MSAVRGILKRRKSVEASCPCVLPVLLLTKTRVPLEETAFVGIHGVGRIGQFSYVPTDFRKDPSHESKRLSEAL